VARGLGFDATLGRRKSVSHVRRSKSWHSEAEHVAKRPIFEVDKVGIYLRDAYDYNGFQALGIWNRDRILSKAESLGVVATSPGKIAGFLGGFEPVFNSTFRDWRASTGRGGDFLIYSDVSWVEPNVKKIPL
jgi:Family of unknown function (DUF6402)